MVYDGLWSTSASFIIHMHFMTDGFDIQLNYRDERWREMNWILFWTDANAMHLLQRWLPAKKKSLDFFLIFISLCLSVVKQIYLRHFLAKLPWLICVLEQSLLLLYQLKVKITRDERARKLISIQMKIIPINADKITNGGPCGPTTKAVCSITCFTISD